MEVKIDALHNKTPEYAQRELFEAFFVTGQGVECMNDLCCFKDKRRFLQVADWNGVVFLV